MTAGRGGCRRRTAATVEPGLVVEAFAEVEPEVLEDSGSVRPFVAGPARVVGGGRDRGEAVDLLVGAAADVVDVDLAGRRVDREAEGVAEAEGDDPALVRVRACA